MSAKTTTWQNSRHEKKYPALETNIEAEVVIIGGGLCGIMSAYLLAKAGVKVVLLEADRLGLGVSAYTTAFVTQELDLSLQDLVRMYGPKKTKLLRQAAAQAIDKLEHIIKTENIACEFERCSTYLYAVKESQVAHLKEEHKMATQLGFKTLLKQDKRLRLPNLGYLETPREAKFDPMMFMQSLAGKAEAYGAKIFERSAVKEAPEGQLVHVRTAKGSVKAKSVIMATYQPFNNPKKPKILKGKVAKYLSYVFEVEVPKGTLPNGMFIDQGNPYHYARLDLGEKVDRLIVGGEDHRKDIPVSANRNFAALERYLQRLLPGVNYKIVRRWNGLLLEPIDGLPYIGEYTPKQYVATGFSGNGMTYSVIAATIFHDQITGRTNDLIKLYDPKRKATLPQLLITGRHFIGLFFGGAMKNLLPRLF